MTDNVDIPENFDWDAFENSVTQPDVRQDFAQTSQTAPAADATPRATPEIARAVVKSPTDFGEGNSVLVEAQSEQELREIYGDSAQIYGASSGWAQEDTGEDPEYLAKWYPQASDPNKRLFRIV
jgi:hypothetical protein